MQVGTILAGLRKPERGLREALSTGPNLWDFNMWQTWEQWDIGSMTQGFGVQGLGLRFNAQKR